MEQAIPTLTSHRPALLTRYLTLEVLSINPKTYTIPQLTML